LLAVGNAFDQFGQTRLRFGDGEGVHVAIMTNADGGRENRRRGVRRRSRDVTTGGWADRLPN
jgi:hypothetical protein